MDHLKVISKAVLEGKNQEIAGFVQSALDNGIQLEDIIDNGLIAGMNEVGVRFKNNEMFIPEVLLSARTMHQGMEVLSPLIKQGDQKDRGKIVIGTVKGDLHDIGKNLVSMMFQGAGYKVIDIGVDQAPERFVAAVRENGAQVVAMSALLTTTMREVESVIDAFKTENLRDSIKIMVGGAPISDEFARKIGADGYAPDAGGAVEKLKELVGSV